VSDSKTEQQQLRCETTGVQQTATDNRTTGNCDEMTSSSMDDHVTPRRRPVNAGTDVDEVRFIRVFSTIKQHMQYSRFSMQLNIVTGYTWTENFIYKAMHRFHYFSLSLSRCIVRMRLSVV